MTLCSLARETLRTQPDVGGSTNQLPLGNTIWIWKGGGSADWIAGAGGEVFLHRISLIFLLFGLLLGVFHPFFASVVGLCRNHGSERGSCLWMTNSEIGNSHRVQIGYDCSSIATGLMDLDGDSVVPVQIFDGDVQSLLGLNMLSLLGSDGMVKGWGDLDGAYVSFTSYDVKTLGCGGIVPEVKTKLVWGYDGIVSSLQKRVSVVFVKRWLAFRMAGDVSAGMTAPQRWSAFVDKGSDLGMAWPLWVWAYIKVGPFLVKLAGLHSLGVDSAMKTAEQEVTPSAGVA